MTHSFPGTAELGYAEITSNATSTTTAATYTDVAGLAVTVTVNGPIKIIFDCSNINNTSTGGVAVAIMEGASILTQTFENIASAVGVPCHREIRLTPTAGSHTYKIGLARVSAAGTATIFATATPAFIQVVRV